jgi:hypothetical protein
LSSVLGSGTIDTDRDVTENSTFESDSSDEYSDDDLEPALKKVKSNNFIFERQGTWVAVAYEEDFFLGQVIEVNSNNSGLVQFLNRGYRDVFRWPKVEDMATIDAEFVFHSDFDCHTPNGRTWLVPDIKQIIKMYQCFRNLYFSD